MSSHEMIIGDDGIPVGFLNTSRVQFYGVCLALDLTAHCGDKAKLQQISADLIEEIGGMEYLAAASCALQIMAGDVLGALTSTGGLGVAILLSAYGDVADGLRANGVPE